MAFGIAFSVNLVVVRYSSSLIKNIGLRLNICLDISNKTIDFELNFIKNDKNNN